MLLKSNAKVKLISPSVTEKIEKLSKANEIGLFKREFKKFDLEGIFLCISATNNRELNKEVSKICRRKNILINVVDNSALCTFIVPAIFSRGDLTICVSTNGSSPGLG